MIVYPGALDAFTDPQAADTMDSADVPHDVQHANLNDAVMALQAKVGVNGSTVNTSLDFLVASLLAAVFNTGGNSSVRFKNGQIQIYDAGYAAIDPTHAWAALTSINGKPAFSDPIAT